MTRHSLPQRLAGATGFALTLTLWLWLLDLRLGRTQGMLVAVGGVLGVFPVVWIGRRVLDGRPTINRAHWVTTVVHFAVMALIGSAIIEAVQLGQTWRGWVIPLPAEVGWLLMMATGTVVVLTVLNLAWRGLGAPFAIALSRRLAIDWMYAWTRNPMVLGGLTFLVALGLWFRSSLFVLWVLVLLMPAILVFVKGYEERELEIRFGASYLEYKARTPMLWPRKPEE